jgi:hypothetical protein
MDDSHGGRMEGRMEGPPFEDALGAHGGATL